MHVHGAFHKLTIYFSQLRLATCTNSTREEYQCFIRDKKHLYGSSFCANCIQQQSYCKTCLVFPECYTTASHMEQLVQRKESISYCIFFKKFFTCPLLLVREATLSVICFCFAATKFILPRLAVVGRTFSIQLKQVFIKRATKLSVLILEIRRAVI